MAQSKQKRHDSPTHHLLVSKAIERFQVELGDDDYITADVRSPEELLAQAKTLEPQGHGSRRKTGSMFRLESILSHISDFAAIAALSSGSSAEITGIVWGSLKVILTLVSQSADTMDEVLHMLDEVSHALPRFRMYEDTLPMTPGLESALVDAYTEMLCFCARTIKFFRSAPHRFLIRAGWPSFDGDFKRTLNKLKDLSQLVDREAEAARLRAEHKRNEELEEALESLKVTTSKEVNLPCYCLPQPSSRSFFGRDSTLQSIDKMLGEDGESTGSTCILLHGLGGVGKSRVALEYASTRRKSYDAVLWVQADGDMKVQHSFLDVGRRLGLISNDDDISETTLAVTKVRNWLASTDCHWLAVFDNVEDWDVVDSISLDSPNGRVLVTSRDETVAFGHATSTYHVQPFNSDIGTHAIFSLLGRPAASDAEKRAATQLVDTLGGLPLAINQISGFVAQQNLSLASFLSLYEKNAAKIDSRATKRQGNERTLSTVWEVALSSLEKDAQHLQSLLALLDPDEIPETILTEYAGVPDNEDCTYLDDDMDFMDAKEPLLKAALIARDAENSTLSMHRLVQVAVIRRLSDAQRTGVLATAMKILGHGFPNTWNTVTSHQFTSWAQCERRVRHVRALIQKKKSFSIRVGAPEEFAELIFRFAWYLYERELYDHADEFLGHGLAMLRDNGSLNYAAACTLRGLVELDTKRLVAARSSFSVALEIRERLLKPDDPLIASSLNALALVATELNDLTEATSHGNRAIDIRLRSDPDRIGNSYSNMASTLLRLGRANEAEEMLGRCPSLKDFSDSTFLESGNPRFAGDMVLLSRIRREQGQTEVALRLASKALTFRQQAHGNQLKTCDSLLLVAQLLAGNDNITAALYYLKEAASIAQGLPFGEGYVAYANYTISTLTSRLGEESEAERYLKIAVDTRNKIPTAGEGLTDDATEEEKYSALVPWMLW